MPSLRLVNPFRSQNSTVITALTLRCGQVWAIDQPFHDARINVFAKSFPDALVPLGGQRYRKHITARLVRVRNEICGRITQLAPTYIAFDVLTQLPLPSS